MIYSRKIQTVFSLVISLFIFTSPALAAAPDGAGPWADNVLSSSQGLMKNGSPVPVIRSNPTSALGVAEGNTVDGNFFSLGFGGKISLGFDNGISSGVIIVEATNPGYPTEKAKIEVSENGTTWVNAGSVSQGGSVNKPAGIGCAKFVRVTDISNPNDFPDATADGYDVDGVKATGAPCNPPTGGGSGGCVYTAIIQKNNTIASTTVISSANSGNNNTNYNTGGSNSIITGNATSNVNVTVTGGSNVVNSTGGCGGGSNNIVISGNGAGSVNTAIINNGSLKNKKKWTAP
jgi:hypothetical protein